MPKVIQKETGFIGSRFERHIRKLSGKHKLSIAFMKEYDYNKKM